MCQKDPDPSAVVRRTTPEVVRAPPDAFCVPRRRCEQDRKSACARAQSCRASIVPRTATREAAREVAGKAALLRAKESLSTGLFAARYRSEQRRLVHTARVILQCYWARDLALRKKCLSRQEVSN